jgi:hypothetical protein
MRKLLPASVAVLVAALAGATEVRRFALDTPRALAGARGQGVAVDPDGTLRALPPLERSAAFDEPLGLALAVAPDGTAWVGTGNPARVWRVGKGGKELVGEPAADQVTALLLDPRGDLYVATAAPALLLRLPRGGGPAIEVGRLAEGNLWDLAWFDGGVVAAAGNPGRLLRLAPRGFELAAAIPDRHARCLAVAGEALLIGTSGKGLILRWDGRATPGVLADSSFTEIAALAVAPDGTAWAAALTGDPTLGKPPSRDTAAGASAEATVTVSAGEGVAPAAAPDKGTNVSEVLRVLANGAVTTAHRFSKQIAGALAWGEQGVVIGTGLEGELWRLGAGVAAQLDAVDAAQVVRIAGGGEWVLTQGPVALLRRGGAPRGTFTSPVLDAGQPAEWGEAAVSVGRPEPGPCTIRFRSGAAAEPDDGWNPWGKAAPCGRVKPDAAPARYLQWQVALDAPAPVVERVEVAYRQLNLPPEVTALTVHEPGEIFLKGPPPSDRVVEVQHPELSGIFTTLGDNDSERQASLGKKYYRVGYRTLSWKVEDPNGDPLRFTVEIQPAGGTAWWPVRDDLESVNLAIDTQALADGVYRFRLTASDEPANPGAPATVQALSGHVTVDNSAPVVTVKRAGELWQVTVEDRRSRVAAVEWNRDADRWHAVAPVDGLLDGPSERFEIPAVAGRHVLAVRATDEHHNRATVAVEEGP